MRPMFTPYMARMRAMVREELENYSPPPRISTALHSDGFDHYMKNLTSVRLEATNNCAYRCVMCPHNAMSRKRGFLSTDDLEFVLKNIHAYNPDYAGDINLQGTGEPFLDNALPQKVELIKCRLPEARVWLITTLGVPRPKEWFTALIDAGLSYLAVSCYGYDRNSYQKAHGADNFDLVMNNFSVLAEIRRNYGGNFQVGYKGLFACSPGTEPDKSYNFLFEPENCRSYDALKKKMKDYGFEFTNSTLHNYGSEHINKCERPVKPCSIYKGKLSHILQIDWDLKVIPCCQITDQNIILGDLRTQSLREIFYASAWTDFKLAHKHMDYEQYPFCGQCLQDTNHWDRFTE
jgi:MoaA/NifB/PqqE/SkfB family radical SAM enzyme